MTPSEFRSCLDLLAWSQRGLARLLDLDDRLVRRWASGTNETGGRGGLDVAAYSGHSLRSGFLTSAAFL